MFSARPGPQDNGNLARRTLAAAANFDEVVAADTLLGAWDKDDTARRKAGLSPALTPAGDIPEAEQLRAAVRTLLSEGMSSVRFGFMADNGLEAVRAMKSWTESLQLPVRGIATHDEDGQPADRKVVAAGPVYLKYEYKDGEGATVAYMKRHIGSNIGVHFNPARQDGEMRFYGDFPLALFENTDGN